MPITTRDKRASVMGSGVDALIVLPQPGTHEQGDRQQVSALYRGVLAHVILYLAQATPLERILKIAGESRALAILAEIRVLAVKEEARNYEDI
jgi:hypothetical protein